MKNSKLSYYLVLITLFLSAFQFSVWGVVEGNYGILRNIIIASIVLLFAVSFRNPFIAIRKIPVIKVHFGGLILFTIILISLLPWDYKINFSPLRDLALTFVIILIGYNLSLSEKQIINIIAIFIVLNAFSALSIVNNFANGFVIHEQYLPIPKNQFAPVYGVAFILALYQGFKTKGFRKIFYFGFAGLLFASLLVIRGRAVIIAVFIKLSGTSNKVLTMPILFKSNFADSIQELIILSNSV